MPFSPSSHRQFVSLAVKLRCPGLSPVPVILEGPFRAKESLNDRQVSVLIKNQEQRGCHILPSPSHLRYPRQFHGCGFLVPRPNPSWATKIFAYCGSKSGSPTLD